MDGIINIYKEKGFTSHDVVAKLRGILHMKKIGHTGTLDPEAEGVLPVCIGTATRLCDMLTEKVKEYRVVMKFGIATDTEDMTGEIIEELPVFFCEPELKSILPKFIGKQNQIPPMYSAIKVEGKKLYELAREGKVIERKAREIEIYDILLHSVITDDENHVKEAELTVICGKGTYIRSLCRDIGTALGTCACMKTLIRTKSGDFNIENSLTLSQVETLRDKNELMKHIIFVEQVFKDCNAFRMKPEWDKLLQNGNHIPEQNCDIVELHSGNRYRAYDSSNHFLGLYEKKGTEFFSVKMFLQ